MGTDTAEIVRNAVDIAVLQTNYEHLDRKMTEIHKDVKEDISTMSAKVDTLLAAMSEQRGKNRLRATAWASMRHLATIVVTLVVAHKFKIPLDVSGG